MTPHELINLPYAGMAEKELKAQGRWYDPNDRLETALDRIDNAASEIETIASDIQSDVTSVIRLIKEATQ